VTDPFRGLSWIIEGFLAEFAKTLPDGTKSFVTLD
jgi:hypothetical protein